MLQAILKHKNLRELRICYKGKISGKEIPYLSDKTVGDLVDGLPHLREFEFAPDEDHIDEIGEVLRRGRQLESITCFPHASWATFPGPDEPGVNILRGIISAFLSATEIDLTSSRDKKLIWEDHFKLSRVSVAYKTWDIASKFGKRRKGAPRPEKMQIDGDDGIRSRFCINRLSRSSAFTSVLIQSLIGW